MATTTPTSARAKNNEVTAPKFSPKCDAVKASFVSHGIDASSAQTAITITTDQATIRILKIASQALSAVALAGWIQTISVIWRLRRACRSLADQIPNCRSYIPGAA